MLSEPCREALAIASVAGREFSVAVVSAASAAPPERVLETLGEALAARVIAEVPQGVGDYRFSHSLVRETLEGELPTAQRVLLHRRVGDALAAIHGAQPELHAAEIAHHYVQAAPGGAAAQAVEWSLRAADRATAQLAY